MKHSTHDETERTREDDRGLAVKVIPTLPQRFIPIGIAALNVVARLDRKLHDIGKSGEALSNPSAVAPMESGRTTRGGVTGERSGGPAQPEGLTSRAAFTGVRGVASKLK